MPKGEWVHWAGTYDGQTMKLYVNGNLVATDATTQHGDIMYPPPTYIQRVNQVTYFVPTQYRWSNVVLNKYNVSAQIHDGWFTLGAYHDANEYWVLNGALDDVRIWGRALTDDQFAMAAGEGGVPCQPADLAVHRNLMYYFKFDELGGGSR